ncbi:hypothetical protein ACSBLW_07515 [Thioclava sp. FR2]|uniref:hypothetical protein n=1 Tax=Thioclava sp. FR2 TaxID=3445780 RepID=UPI003EBF6060
MQPFRTLAFLCTFALAACQAAAPALVDDPMPTTGTEADTQIHVLTIERAYTLEDSRDFEFRQQVAAEAAQICGRAGHSIQSTHPFGPERIGEDFLYRMVEVGIACNS